MPRPGGCGRSVQREAPIPINMNLQTTELIIVAAVAFVMLLQAIFMVALFVVVRKTIAKVHDELNETRAAVTAVIQKVQPVVEKLPAIVEKVPPIIENVRVLLAKNGPKIESAVADLVVVTQKLRAETNDMQVAATEIVGRVKRQSARIDGMTTKTLDAVEHAARFVTDTLGKPIRQLGAVLASARAVMDTLRTPTHDGHVRHVDQVRDPDYYA
jgi:ABC-type transporter Mla subunit MlaD